MKKFLLISMLFIITPSFAICPIGDGESVCTISGNNLNSIPLGSNNDKVNINSLNTNSRNMNPNIKFESAQPSSLNNSFGSTQNKSGIQMNSSLSCQFGNCNKNTNESDFLPNQ